MDNPNKPYFPTGIPVEPVIEEKKVVTLGDYVKEINERLERVEKAISKSKS